MSALKAEPAEALKFGRLDVLEEDEDKQDVLDGSYHSASERSLAEVKLVQRMIRDMFVTLDQEKSDEGRQPNLFLSQTE